MDESTKPTVNTLDDLCPCILDQIQKSIARKKRDAELDHLLNLVEQCKPKKLTDN